MVVRSGDLRVSSLDRATRRWPWQSQGVPPATPALPGEWWYNRCSKVSEPERSSQAFRTSSFRPRNLQTSLAASRRCIMLYIIRTWAQMGQWACVEAVYVYWIAHQGTVVSHVEFWKQKSLGTTRGFKTVCRGELILTLPRPSCRLYWWSHSHGWICFLCSSWMRKVSCCKQNQMCDKNWKKWHRMIKFWQGRTAQKLKDSDEGDPENRV
jgi:hypothetical protein